jgi:hypothetical protein
MSDLMVVAAAEPAPASAAELAARIPVPQHLPERYEEIATQYAGVTKRTVERQIHHGRRKLKTAASLNASGRAKEVAPTLAITLAAAYFLPLLRTAGARAAFGRALAPLAVAPRALEPRAVVGLAFLERDAPLRALAVSAALARLAAALPADLTALPAARTAASPSLTILPAARLACPADFSASFAWRVAAAFFAAPDLCAFV